MQGKDKLSRRNFLALGAATMGIVTSRPIFAADSLPHDSPIGEFRRAYLRVEGIRSESTKTLLSNLQNDYHLPMPLRVSALTEEDAFTATVEFPGGKALFLDGRSGGDISGNVHSTKGALDLPLSGVNRTANTENPAALDWAEKVIELLEEAARQKRAVRWDAQRESVVNAPLRVPHP